MGLDLGRHFSRLKYCCIWVACDRTGFTNQRRAVYTTERERVVPFNAITCWAAFHFIVVGVATEGRTTRQFTSSPVRSNSELP